MHIRAGALAHYRDKKDTVRFVLIKPILLAIVDLIFHNQLDKMAQADKA